MGFLSDLWSGVCEFCSTVCEAFKSVGSTLGTALHGLALLFPPLSPVISVVAVIVSGIANLLGLINKEETTEELGYKAQQALETRELKPENFDSYKEYLAEVRKEPIDNEKLKSLNLEESNTCKLLGTRILGNCIGEEVGIEVTDEFLRDCGKMSLSPTLALGIIENFKKNGSTSMKDMTDYMAEKIDADKVDGCSKALEDAIKAENPDATKKDIADQIRDWEKSIQAPDSI